MSERRHHNQGLRGALTGLFLVCWGGTAWATAEVPLRVAVAAPDIEAIVKTVGGDQVETFTLFTGCILRRELQVEAAAEAALLSADAVVWTGFMPEALAVRIAVSNAHDGDLRNSWCPRWIDVSQGAVQMDPAVSSLTSSVEYAKDAKVNVVLLDPHTPVPVAKALREAVGWQVFDVPSSIAGIPGARTYADLFDNMIGVLRKAAAQP